MTKAALFFVAFLATFLIAQSLNQPSHNITWGTRNPSDIHLQRVVVFKKSKFLRKVSDDYEFNLKQTPYVRMITQVTCTDQYKDGNGGYATLASGGPMTSSVKIHFTSQRNHGYNFIIDIWGR